MPDLSQVSTEDLLAQHYGGMDKVPTDVLMKHYKAPAAAPKEPDLVSKLNGYLAAANRVVNPVSGLVRDIAEPGKAMDRAKAGLDGLRQNQTESKDPEARALNVAGRYGPAVAATALFPPTGAADLAGLAAMRAGAVPMVGSAARLAAAAASAGTTAGLGTLAASTAVGDPAPTESAQVGKEFAEGELAAPAIGAAAKGVWRGGKAIAAGALERSGSLFSGIPAAAWETLDKAGEKVAGYARQGMTTDADNKPVARALELAKNLSQAAKEKAQGFGRAAQAKIDQVASGAGKNYQAMMSYLHEDASGSKFDVAGKVFDRMEPYIKQQGAELRSPIGAKAEDASKIFHTYYQRIKSSLQEGMNPGEAADILQGLTDVQRNYKGKSASAHAAELKKALMEALPGEWRYPTIDTPTPGGWSIADTRSEYRAAKETQRGLKKFSASENPQSALEKLIAAGGKTGEAIKAAMGPKGVPGFSDDVAAMRGAEEAARPEIATAKAGAAFAPKFTQNLPRTGLTAGAASTVAKMLGGDATAIAAAPLEILGMSPRYAMETRLAAKKGSAALESYVDKNASKFPAVIANALRASRENK